jgi:nucleotide-binding universal stress UspA family protein
VALTDDIMYDSILLPTDGSEGAIEALDHALSAAEAYGADLHIVSVVDRRVILAADADEKSAVREELSEDAAAAVDELATRAMDAGVATTTATPEGVPYREILSYGDEESIDLLVIGTQGRTGKEKRLNLGSTTERIVKKADRPVLVVDIG